MSLVLGIEPLATCWNEAMGLAEMHWKETEGYRHNQPFAPSLARYENFEKAGMFLMFTARDGERLGILVGHLGVYLCRSMHSQELIVTEDALFLHPDYRKGRNAVRLIQFAEAECRRRGAVEISITAKLTNPIDRLLRYLDYVPNSVHYSKNLALADSRPLQQAVEVKPCAHQVPQTT